MEGVTGSIPVAPTNHNMLFWLDFIFPHTDEIPPTFGPSRDWFGSLSV
jgi:hypothetical protein